MLTFYFEVWIFEASYFRSHKIIFEFADPRYIKFVEVAQLFIITRLLINKPLSLIRKGAIFDDHQIANVVGYRRIDKERYLKILLRQVDGALAELVYLEAVARFLLI